MTCIIVNPESDEPIITAESDEPVVTAECAFYEPPEPEPEPEREYTDEFSEEYT